MQHPSGQRRWTGGWLAVCFAGASASWSCNHKTHSLVSN